MVARRKRSIEAIIRLDGLKLHWRLYREPQWTTEDGYKGHSIIVRVAEGTGRELLLEYPFPKKKPNGIPHFPVRPKIVLKAVEADIRRAMAAGWNPTSRGKTFAFQVPENSN